MSIVTKVRTQIIRAATPAIPTNSSLNRTSVYLGADPEFFFSKKDKTRTVVGSELVLPGATHDVSRGGKLIIDGVQAEMNPAPSMCRQSFGHNIYALIEEARRLAETKGLEINLDACIKMTKRQMDKLSDGAKGFGCKPSLNAYQDYVELPNPGTYLHRAAGGHIHLGKAYNPELAGTATNDEIVKILDIVVGNTCVMLDRDKGNIERRKVYGRAGEYRVPAHGIEYRTLSNFWLKNNVLMSLVMALARFGVCIAATPEWKDAFLNAVKEEDIRNAINKNDAKLAAKNFNKLLPLFTKINMPSDPLTPQRVIALKELIRVGIEKKFNGRPWGETAPSSVGGHYIGWESFADNLQKNVQRRKAAKQDDNS